MNEEQKCNCNGGFALPKLMLIFLIIILICGSLMLISFTRNSIREFDYIGKSKDVPNTIAISGEGEVFAVPDIAKVSIGMQAEAKTVEVAQAENTKVMNAIVAGVKELGIEDKDIKTNNYNINPKYDWTDGKSQVIGYYVNQSIEVKVRDTKNVSKVIQLAGEKGANQVSNLGFEIDDETGLQSQAREVAIKDAKSKAEELAGSLGVKLGKVVSFSESNASEPQVYRAEMSFGVSKDAVSAPTVELGENSIKSYVTIVFEIL